MNPLQFTPEGAQRSEENARFYLKQCAQIRAVSLRQWRTARKILATHSPIQLGQEVVAEGDHYMDGKFRFEGKVVEIDADTRCRYIYRVMGRRYPINEPKNFTHSGVAKFLEGQIIVKNKS